MLLCSVYCSVKYIKCELEVVNISFVNVLIERNYSVVRATLRRFKLLLNSVITITKREAIIFIHMIQVKFIIACC